MGCGGSKTQSIERPVGKLTVAAVAKPKVALYGDVNQALTREILTAMHMSGVTKEEIEYHEVQIAKGDNLTHDYLQMNPLGTVPVLKEDTTLVLGTSLPVFLEYLQSSSSLSAKFQTLSSKRAGIESGLKWIEASVAPLVQRAKNNDQEARKVLIEILAKYKSADKYVDSVLYHEVKDLKLSNDWLKAQETELSASLGFIESLRGQK